MINDSDEEVIYEGSDTEELLSFSGPEDEVVKLGEQPNQSQPISLGMHNLMDTHTDEESD